MDEPTAREQSRTFGLLLRHHRVAAGLSQEQLAEQAGLTAQGISALERGLRQAPYRDTVQRLAAALNLTPADHRAFDAAISRGRGTLSLVSASAPSSAPASSPAPALSPFDPPVPQTAPHATPAELSPLRVSRQTLPVLLTPLIGRARELGEICDLLGTERVRLVTLTGTGGVGKTSLAVQVAWSVADHFAGGVVFVPLAAVQDPDRVLVAIAQALDLRESGHQSVRDTLVAALREQQLLVVLDNVEQVVGAAPLLGTLLADCPQLQILVTSRALLHVRGERRYPLSPLATPDLSALPAVDALAVISSVALLVQRARDRVPDFGLTDTNAAVIAAICRTLDGLPLALELAAARLTVLSPQLLLEHLAHRPTLLTGGSRDLPARQQTLRAALAWSYDLLTPREQAVFRRFAVFRGGGTLPALVAVCADVGSPEMSLIDDVSALIDQSLLQRETRGDAVRVTMLETLREFAYEQLTLSGEDDSIRARHAAYYNALVQQASPQLTGGEQQMWLASLDADADNVLAVLEWSLAQDDCALGLRVAGSLWRYWYARGDLSHGRDWLGRVLHAMEHAEDRPSDDARALVPVHAQALYGAAGLAWAQGDLQEAAALGERSLALFQSIADGRGSANTLTVLANVALEQGAYERAAALLSACLTGWRVLDDQRGVATALHNLGVIARDQGELDRAQSLYEESLGIKRRLGDNAAIAATLGNLGDLAVLHRDHISAAAYLEECVTLRRTLGDRFGLAVTLNNMGSLAYMQGDRNRAIALCEESVALARAIDARGEIVLPLGGLGQVALDEGDSVRAATLYQDGLAICEQTGQPRDIAACLAGVAGVALIAGKPLQAAVLCGAATAMWDTLGVLVQPSERGIFDAVVAAAQERLGDDTFTHAWSTGRSLSVREALVQAHEMVSTVLRGGGTRV